MTGANLTTPSPFCISRDRSVKPGVDFFHFANGGLIQANPIPPDRSEWGAHEAIDMERSPNDPLDITQLKSGTVSRA